MDKLIEIISGFCNVKIIVTTRKVAKRKIGIKFIDKILLRLFGYNYYDVQKDGQIIYFDNNLYMTENDYQLLKNELFNELQNHRDTTEYFRRNYLM